MVTTDRMFGTTEEWQNKETRARLSIQCINCPAMTKTPPCCLECTNRCLGVTIKKTPHPGCGLFATRHLKVVDVIVPYLALLRNCKKAEAQSGYTAEIVPDKRYIDATLLRGLGSFANQSNQPDVDTLLRTFNNDQFPLKSTLRSSREKGKPSFPLVLQKPLFPGFQYPWIIARTKIKPCTERKMDYGQEAYDIDNLPQVTFPFFF